MKNTLFSLKMVFLLSCLVISNTLLAQQVNNLTTSQPPNSSKDLPDKGVPLAINSFTIAAKTYTNEGKITSAGRVESSSSVTFKSGYAIELKPGFVAEKGSFFEAYISTADNPNGVKNPSVKNAKTSDVLKQNVAHRLFPNPTTDNFTLEITAENEGKADIIVFNALGGIKLTKPFALNKGIQQVSINCNDWASGLYLISIKTDNAVKSERLVISKH